MTNSIIEVRNLHKQYKNHKVIHDVSFQVKKGSICGLIGTNAAGKTTIMKKFWSILLKEIYVIYKRRGTTEYGT